MRDILILLCLVISCLFIHGKTNAGVLADSVADWQAAIVDDGVVSQGELNWEYGYISSYTGAGGAFYGWHQNSFYWESSSGINIFWPAGEVTPDIAWGQGGDATGCRPPMSWIDGGYPWAGNEMDKWASVRRWTSNYTGLIKISGGIGRYFDTNVVIGWDVDFSVAVNADMPGAPVIYTKNITWDDTTYYTYLIDKVPIKAGDTVVFIINATSWNANNSYMKMTTKIATASPEPVGDMSLDHHVNMIDYSMFASQWSQTDCIVKNWCDGADFDHSNDVNMADLAIFVTHWLEFTYPVGDLNFNYSVNMTDFSLFALQWLQTDCIAEDWCGGADFDHSGEVNSVDLGVFVMHWLE